MVKTNKNPAEIGRIVKMVKTSGFEPPTPCMSSRYSNQLSYAFIT